MKTILLSTIFFLLSVLSVQAQAKNDWFHIPGFDPASPLTLTNQETFIGLAGFVAISFILEEFVLKNHENVVYYNSRIGMNNEYAWGLKNVWHQNAGIEYRVANWFSVAAAINIQQWHDKTPGIDKKAGMGTGLMSYYRWHVLGKRKISPYLEYGTGLFFGWSKFPYNGTNFTFSHSTQVGIEYTLKNESKIRLGYGNFHQSNNNWLNSNPGYDGNGFSISYAWRMK